MKKNVAGQTVGAQLISKTDGTAVTTGSTEVYVTGDAGTQTASSGSPSGAVHEGQGYWSFMPTQAETNYDHIAFTFVNSSAVNVTVQIYTSFPQTGDNFARLGAPAGASVSADVAAIKSEEDLIKANTDKLGDTFVADGSPGNYRFSTNALSGVWDSQRGGHALTGSFGEGVVVSSIATDAVNANALATDAVTEIQSGLATSASLSLVRANTDKLGDTFVADGSPGNYRFSTNALSGVWDSQRGGHALVGSFGEGVSSVQGNVTGSAASVTGAVGSVTGNVGGNVTGSVGSVVGAVGSVTGNVGGNVTGSVGSVASGGIAASSFAAGAIDAAAIATDAIGALELAAGAASEIATAVRTELTTELGRIDATVSSRATQTSVDAVDDFVDTEVAAIKAVTDKVDTMLQTGSPVNDYIFTTAALANAGGSASAIADAVWDEARAGHVGAGSFGEGVEVATKTGFRLSSTGVDDIHDEVVDGVTTFRESIRLHNATLGGKASGLATTTAIYRDLADSKDRVSATVDADGNRSAVTLDLAP